jgi:hypothetical protein
MVGPFPDCRDPSICLGGWRRQVTYFGQAAMGLKFDKDSFIRLLASFHSFGHSHHKMYGVAQYPPSLFLSKGLAGKTLGREEPNLQTELSRLQPFAETEEIRGLVDNILASMETLKGFAHEQLAVFELGLEPPVSLKPSSSIMGRDKIE